MPLRSTSSIIRSTRHAYGQRLFTISATHSNHYETLQIPHDATPKAVKESFYNLSKTHHPDCNPDDPTASERFIKINDAYTTLGTPAKRQAYDRDVMGAQPTHGSVRQGSYSSSGPAGARPASGLSRRRTQFRGPPTSFYRSGGWGEHGAKRAAAQQNGAPGAESSKEDEGMDGMGLGQRPWGHGNDVPHFDKKGHFGTHESIDQRRRNRMRRHEARRGEEDMGKGMGMLGQFFLLSGIVAFGVLIPGMLFEQMKRTPKKKDK